MRKTMATNRNMCGSMCKDYARIPDLKYAIASPPQIH